MSNPETWGANISSNNAEVKQNNNNGIDVPMMENGQDLLTQLFSEASLFNPSRDVPEVGEVVKALNNRLSRFEGQTLSAAQRKILPEIKELSKQVYDRLPGLVMSVEMGQTVLVMPVVFISSKLACEMDTFDVQVAGGSQQMATPIAPNQYIDDQLARNVRRLYAGSFDDIETLTEREAVAQGRKIVNIVSIRMVDLDMYKDPMLLARDDREALIEVIANELIAGWYAGVLSQLTQMYVGKGRNVTSPFVNGKAYGNEGCAMVRVEPIREPISVSGQLTSYNVVAKMATTNPNSNRNNQSNTKTVIEAYGTVSLFGQSLSGYNQSPARIANGNMLNPQTGLPHGYHPFIPVIVYGESNPGQTMGENSGLGTFFMGLYNLLTTNASQLFSEPLRLAANGSRGNLVDMEYRLKALVNQGGFVRQVETILDEKKRSDADFVTNWIRNYIAPNAAIAIDLINFGRNTQEANFLMSTMDRENKANAMRVVIATIDSLTKGALSRELNSDKCEWKPFEDGILMSTNILIPHGVFKHNEKWVDMGEIDEMFLSHFYKNDQAKVADILSKFYGTDVNLDIKARRLAIRRALSELTDGQFYLDGFKSRTFLNPKFLKVFTKVMGEIGTVMVNGTVGNYITAPIAFDQISQYVTAAAAGTVGFSPANVQPVNIIFGSSGYRQ